MAALSSASEPRDLRRGLLLCFDLAQHGLDLAQVVHVFEEAQSWMASRWAMRYCFQVPKVAYMLL